MVYRKDLKGSVILRENKSTISDKTSNKTDVSIIPFIRESDIEFVGFNLRPNRESWFYFDNEGMNNFVSRPNIIVMDTRKNFKGVLLHSPQEEITIVGGRAEVLHTETNSDGNTVLYISQIKSPKCNVHIGNTVVGVRSSLVANVTAYEHSTGFVRSGATTTTIPIAVDASTSNNYYVGNVITVTTGSACGQSRNVTSYNGVTKVITLSPALSAAPKKNDIYSIGDRRRSYAANSRQSHFTTDGGFITGILHLTDPSANTQYAFRTGERLFRILDNPQNQVTTSDGERAYTSRAEYPYKAEGLQVKQTTVRQVKTVTQQVRVSTTVYDPIAQSFFVDGDVYTEGFFCPSVDLYFKNKGTALPISLQIRPMDGGFPHSTEILPDGISVLQPDSVIVSERPNVQNSLTRTRFSFPSPVYLEPDREYAFVILTNDYGYDLWVSEVGQKAVGTDRIVSTQPYLGTLFKSQSGRTFTAHQDEDVMFTVNKCVFSTSGSIVFNEEKKANSRIPYLANDDTFIANTDFDFFHLASQSTILPGTKIDSFYRTTSNATGLLDTSYQEFIPNKNTLLEERKILYGDEYASSVNVQMLLSTTNPDVSPVIDYDKQNFVVVQNKINNMGLSNDIIAIANTGSSYGNHSLTFSTSSTGLQANGYIIANSVTGAIESVIIDNPGAGYFDNVSVTIQSSTGSGGVILVNSETDKSGGPAYARYISKTIELKDGFNAGDLRCFVTAVKPASANVQVYYKVRNKLDAETIADKNWVKMVQATSAFDYSQAFEPIEYEYRPSMNSNTISYSTVTATYKTFNEFKIKIVLASESTLYQDVPFLYDVTAMAFPGDEF